jgi:4-amino-4-deoxy-L-arabinose transferase-like glycosyltransferase
VRLDGINRYTYWMTPLYMVVQAGWFKIVGFDILRARAASVMWGIVALLAWWTIAAHLTDRLTAAIAMLLIAVEYNFVWAAADARMDMMTAALGSLALALYLRERERGFLRALLLTHIALAAAVLTHPIAVAYGLAWLIAVLLLDRKHVQWKYLPLCAAPYLVAAAAWGLYIAQAPQLFLTQFAGNATERGPGLTQAWAALKLELGHRYAENFGMAAWTSGPARAKIAIALLYIGGAAWVVASRDRHSKTGVRVVLACTAAVLVFFWLFEGSKTPVYLPHTLPWMCLLAAIALADVAMRPALIRYAVPALLIAVVAIQTLSTAMPARRDPYRTLYAPTMAFLSQHLRPTDTVMGDSAIGWALGFDRPVVDDAWLGYRTGKKLDWLVVTPVYAGTIESASHNRPEVYRHIAGLLADYRQVWAIKDYRIYVRHSSAPALREFADARVP